MTEHGRWCLCDACIGPSRAQKRRRRNQVYAQREWIKDRSRRQGGYWRHPDPGPLGHGSRSTYSTYGCQCEPCMEAMREVNFYAKRGVPAPRERAIDSRKAIEMLQEGRRLSVIAEYFGVSVERLREVLSEAGVEFRSGA